MPRRLLPLLPLLLLACGTPQEQCIRSVTRDLRVIDDLISDAEINLGRGYGMEEVTVWVPSWDYCGPPVMVLDSDGQQRLVQPPQMCMDEEATTITRPVAIDLNAERRKLAQLKKQRSVLEKRAEPAIAQCRAQFPE